MDAYRRISIHAPLTGSDLHHAEPKIPAIHFNPRSPYGERLTVNLSHSYSPPFQSTLPLRGATLVRHLPGRVYLDFNPRSPYGERLKIYHRLMCNHLFQSTLPLRGATTAYPDEGHAFGISIHAPLTGSDSSGITSWNLFFYFNPRSPYGERPKESFFVWYYLRFQSTLPLRGATDFRTAVNVCRIFQSTLPLRGATSHHSPWCLLLLISIHAPLTGSDNKRSDINANARNFNPRSPYGERP